MSFTKMRPSRGRQTSAPDEADAVNVAILDRVTSALNSNAPECILPEVVAPDRFVDEPVPSPDPNGSPTRQVANAASAKRPLRDKVRKIWEDWASLRHFAVATLAPVPLLMIGAFAGGAWALFALMTMTVLVYALDKLLILPDSTPMRAVDLRRAEQLSVALAGVHFLVLLVGVFALSGGTGLGFPAWLAVFAGFGLWIGQVSNSNAHELIHRSDKRLFQLGQWVFISLLFGHHTSAHRLVHHRFVATSDDPNTAAAGESFYAFAPRAWWEAMLAGYEMESERRKDHDTERLFDLHPYAVYIGGGMICLIIVVMLFGGFGILAYLALCAHAQLQLLLSDYVQHYGLLRQKRADGSLEPAGPGHSWNAPHPVSGLMMLNAPRHSDHHSHPARPYPELKMPATNSAPVLPHSLPVMGAIALVPRLWFRTMDNRLARLRPDRWSRPIL